MSRAIVSWLLLLATGAGLAQQPKPVAVAVMPLRGAGIPESDVKFLTDRLVIELQRAGVFEVMERDRMDEILKEQGFQQTGACDETACLVEAGRLLPVEKIIGGSVGKVGYVYSAQIRLIDLKTGKVEKTATRDYRGEMEHLLTVGMRESAEELSGKRGSQAQATAPVSSQDQDLMKKMLEAQYEDKKKSKGWAVFWSVLIPGVGNYYAKNPIAGTIFLVGGFGLQAAWISQTNSSDTATSTGVAEKKSSKTSVLGLIYIGVRVIDTIVATRSVDRYNKKLREKYGLTLKAMPYKGKMYATAGFDF